MGLGRHRISWLFFVLSFRIIKSIRGFDLQRSILSPWTYKVAACIGMTTLRLGWSSIIGSCISLRVVGSRIVVSWKFRSVWSGSGISWSNWLLSWRLKCGLYYWLFGRLQLKWGLSRIAYITWLFRDVEISCRWRLVLFLFECCWTSFIWFWLTANQRYLLFTFADFGRRLYLIA